MRISENGRERFGQTRLSGRSKILLLEGDQWIFVENFHLHQTGSIYVLLILFGVCFSKQKILSTYVWKVSRCLEKSVEVLAFNSFVSVSLVLLMEGFLEGTQRFNFDFNYQSTSSVEKHNTVWQCERLKVLTFYLTPVTLLYIVWRVQSAFLHHLNLSNTTTESSYLFVLLYDKLFLEILGAEKFQTYVLWCMHLHTSQTCLIFVSSCSSYLSNGHDVIFNSGL